MGDDIEGDLFGVVLGGCFFVGVDFFCLLEEFVHGFASCAGDGLVGCCEDASEGIDAMERREREQGDDGRAVGVSDQPFVAELLQGGGVHFGNDEGNIFVQAEVGGVVDDEGDFFREAGQKLLGEGCAGAGEDDVRLREVEAFQILCFQRFVSVGDVCSERLGGGERVDAFRGKVSFGEDGDEFSSDIACRSDDGDIVRGHGKRGGGERRGRGECREASVREVAYYRPEGKARGARHKGGAR